MCRDLRRLDKVVGLETTCEITVIVHLPLIIISRIILHFMKSFIEMDS